MALTKLDVLDSFDKIKICTAYKFNNKIYNYIPPNLNPKDNIEKKYIELDGWNKTTRGCRNFNDLPINAKKYISTLRDLTGIEISLLSTSPEREDTILFKDPFI